MNIKEDLLPDSQYFKQVTKKTMIVIHHTVSPGHDSNGDRNWWLSDPGRIATHCIITQDGTIHKTIDSAYWGHHIGLKSGNNVALNKASYSIELDSLGPVDEHGYSLAYKGMRCTAGIQEYSKPFRGFRFFEKYTSLQIEALRELMLAMSEKFQIDLTYRPAMWDVCADALNGENGFWTHVSFRSDKSDCHPQPDLIEMLKRLSKKQ